VLFRDRDIEVQRFLHSSKYRNEHASVRLFYFTQQPIGDNNLG